MILKTILIAVALGTAIGAANAQEAKVPTDRANDQQPSLVDFLTKNQTSITQGLEKLRQIDPERASVITGALTLSSVSATNPLLAEMFCAEEGCRTLSEEKSTQICILRAQSDAMERSGMDWRSSLLDSIPRDLSVRVNPPISKKLREKLQRDCLVTFTVPIFRRDYTPEEIGELLNLPNKQECDELASEIEQLHNELNEFQRVNAEPEIPLSDANKARLIAEITTRIVELTIDFNDKNCTIVASIDRPL